MTSRASLYLVFYLVLVGCSTKMDDLRLSGEQMERMAELYDQANAQLDMDTAKAIQTAKYMLESAEFLEYRAGIGDAHYLLGIAYDFKGKYDSSAYHHLIALQERRELNDEKKKGKSYVNLGILYWHLGLIKEARDCQETAIAIWKKSGNVKSEANAYHNLGLIEQDDKKYDQAESAYQCSLHLHQQLGNHAKVARLYNDLAAVNELKGNQDNRKILGYYEKALKTTQSSNDGYAIGWLHCNIGRAYNSLNKADSALFFLSKAKNYLELLPGRKRSLVVVYNAMAEAHRSKKEWKQAIQVLEKAERLENQVTGKLREVYLETYQLFRDIYKAQHNPAQVRNYQKKYQGIQAELVKITVLAENVQLKNQVEVKNLEQFFLWKTYREMERMYDLMQMVLIPMCLMLIIGGWRHYKQSKMNRIYQNLLMDGMPHFKFDERESDKDDDK